jgi:glycosyltransferase involved in cell wall biosynthesis
MTEVDIYGIMMVKNEETNIARSLQSFIGMKGVFLYDTGSTDKTIEVAIDECKKLGLMLNIKRGTFVDFSTSRNVLFDHIAQFNVEPSKSTSTMNGGGGEKTTKKSVKERLKNKIESRSSADGIDYGEGDKPPFGVKWLVLLDANDELQGLNSLKKALKGVVDYDEVVNGKVIRRVCDVVYLRQRWQTTQGHFTNFKNMRCVRSDSSMRFFYVVHEVLLDRDVVCRKCLSPNVECCQDARNPLDTRWWCICHRCTETFFNPVTKKHEERKTEYIFGDTCPQKFRDTIYAPEDVIVYQDRQLDTTQSSERRWHRDKIMLQEQYDKWPVGKKDPRYTFYLAQTCKCLKKYKESCDYYTERFMNKAGFQEEIFVSAWEAAKLKYILFDECVKNGNKDEATKLYKDFIYYIFEALKVDMRAEPLVNLAEDCFAKNQWHLSYMLAKAACDLPIPNILLWYDEGTYSYIRYHMLAKFALLVGKPSVGRWANSKAVLSNSPSNNDIQIRQTILNGKTFMGYDDESGIVELSKFSSAFEKIQTELEKIEMDLVYGDAMEESKGILEKLRVPPPSFQPLSEEFIKEKLSSLQPTERKKWLEKTNASLRSQHHHDVEVWLVNFNEGWKDALFYMFIAMGVNPKKVYPVKMLAEMFSRCSKYFTNKSYSKSVAKMFLDYWNDMRNDISFDDESEKDITELKDMC